MNYLIIATDSIIDKEIKHIIDENNIDNNNIYHFDLDEVSFLKPLEILDTINMFESKKIVICKNLGKLDEEDKFINYLKNPSQNILILCNNTKPTKKIFDSLNEFVTIIDTEENIFDYIKRSFKDYKIDFRTIRLIEEYTSGDLNRIINEIEKLKQYRFDTKMIELTDVEELITKDISSNIFNLIDAIDDGNKEKAFKVYNELLKIGEDEIKIINMLAKNYRLIFQVKILGLNHNLKEIKDITKAHQYAISKAQSKSYNYTLDELKLILQKLSMIDIRIKTGEVDKKIELPLFIASM